MRVDEANEFFATIPRIHNKLKTICDVGLGYIKMGQPATTLSGGEAQRVKLATELSRRSTGRTFYVLDEPTTGLHFADIHKLLEVLQRLVETGNSVLVIEHNLDVVKTADYLIDLGPEGGDRGGTVVGVGTPEELSANRASYTGAYLVPVLRDQRAVGHHLPDVRRLEDLERENLRVLDDLAKSERVENRGMKAEERAAELRARLEEANVRYYVLDEPAITDAEYRRDAPRTRRVRDGAPGATHRRLADAARRSSGCRAFSRPTSTALRC